MNEEECLKTIQIINDYLKKYLWMDFELCEIDGWRIVLSGKIDELQDELIEISFIQPYMISCLMYFTYEEGDFISLVQGKEAGEINGKYEILQGNHIFKLVVNDSKEMFFITAKEIRVNIKDNKIKN